MRLSIILSLIACVILAACGSAGQGRRGNSASVITNVDPNIPLAEQILRLPGVYLNENRELRIRGSTQPPLLVVDGMQAMTADLRTINPSDVRRVEIIKGPETSIYGLRGGGGVIVITTKSGGS